MKRNALISFLNDRNFAVRTAKMHGLLINLFIASSTLHNRPCSLFEVNEKREERKKKKERKWFQRVVFEYDAPVILATK